MPLDPHAQRFLRMIAVGGAPTEDWAARRKAYASLMELVRDRAPARCASRDLVISGPGGDLPLRIYTPPSMAAEASPALVFLHGGGWVAGDLDTHACVCDALAAAGGVSVIAVDYRLAPEHQHPAALADAEAAARWVFAQAGALRFDPRRIAISGDSAGANLAAALCLKLRGDSVARFALQVLLCPFLDLEADTESRRAFGQGFFLDLDAMARDLDLSIPPTTRRDDPLLSPLRAENFSGLPPAQIHTAECDPMRDEGASYAERLNAAGVAARHVRHAGMIHQFYAMGGVIPHAAPALCEIGASLGEALRAVHSGN